MNRPELKPAMVSLKYMERGASFGGERLQQTEGERYLELLGLGNLADQAIPDHLATRPQQQMRDFLEICGDHALPVLVGLDSLDRDDPRFIQARADLAGFVTKFAVGSES